MANKYQYVLDDWDHVANELFEWYKIEGSKELKELMGCLIHDGNGHQRMAWMKEKEAPYHHSYALYVMWLTSKYILRNKIM